MFNITACSLTSSDYKGASARLLAIPKGGCIGMSIFQEVGCMDKYVYFPGRSHAVHLKNVTAVLHTMDCDLIGRGRHGGWQYWISLSYLQYRTSGCIVNNFGSCTTLAPIC